MNPNAWTAQELDGLVKLIFQWLEARPGEPRLVNLALEVVREEVEEKGIPDLLSYLRSKGLPLP